MVECGFSRIVALMASAPGLDFSSRHLLKQGMISHSNPVRMGQSSLAEPVFSYRAYVA